MRGKRGFITPAYQALTGQEGDRMGRLSSPATDGDGFEGCPDSTQVIYFKSAEARITVIQSCSYPMGQVRPKANHETKDLE